MSDRKPKFKREPDQKPIMLTARDIGILASVWRFRFMRSDQIARLIAFKFSGSSPVKIKSRLQELFHGGYLDRPLSQRRFFAEGIDKRFIYGLSNSGAQAVCDYRNVSVPLGLSFKNTKITQPNLLHTTAIAEIVIALEITFGDMFLSQDTLLEEEGGKLPPLLVKFAYESEQEKQIASERIIPDYLFGLKFEDGTRSLFFIEADRGTMPILRHGPKQTSLMMKVRSYMAGRQQKLWQTHFKHEHVRTLFVVPSQIRAQNLQNAVASETGGRGSTQFLFATYDIFAALEQDSLFATGKDGFVSLMT